MTNNCIARLILEQTYEEREAFALFLSTAVVDLVENELPPTEFDMPYFADLLYSWAEMNWDKE